MFPLCAPYDDIQTNIHIDVATRSINLHETNIIATSGDNLLRLERGLLYMSSDLGNTWKSLENTVGIISYVHWFKDHSCLICGRSKAYWADSSFSQLRPSLVLDYDGSVIDDDSPHFYTSLHGHKDYEELNGRETLIWSDYFGGVNGYIARIWQTDDCGRTIKCICKNRETKTDDGLLISCRHFHDCVLRESCGELYITSGDDGEQCLLIKGDLFKFDSVTIEEPYLFFLCDYTGYGRTGIMKVEISEADRIECYQYVYRCPENLPLIRIYSINHYSLVIYDGSVKGKLLVSRNSGQYKNMSVTFDNQLSSISFLSNQNNSGLVLIRRGNGSDITDLKLNGCMYNFSEAMEEAGYRDFSLLN